MKELWPHQARAVGYAMRAPRSLIGVGMGGGKSAIALVTARKLNAFPIIVVSPSIVKPKWGTEVEEWLPGHSFQILEAGDTVLPGKSVYILHWALVDGMVRRKKGEEQSDLAKKRALRTTKLVDSLLATNPSMIVADESAHMKSGSSNRTKVMKRLARRIPVRLALTGTPVDNGPEDLISQLDFLDQLNLFDGAWLFKKRYCVKVHHDGSITSCKHETCARPLRGRARGTCPGCPGWARCECGKNVWGYWEFGGANNLMELNARLTANCYIRVPKEQLDRSLPAFRREIIPLAIERTEYDKAVADFIGWMTENRGEEAARRAFRAEAIVRMEVLRQMALDGKLGQAAEWLGDLVAAGEPVVAFVTHRKASEALQKALSLWDPRIIDGGTPPEQRERDLAAFQKGAVRLLIVNIRTGGQGIELTAAAHCAFFELDWTPTAHEQAEARLHRPGQTRPVTAWYLLGKETIDETIFRVLEGKRRVIAEVVDGDAESGTPFDVEMEVAHGLAQGLPAVRQPGPEEGEEAEG